MSSIIISDSIKYAGADDHGIDLFESQYPVPNGVSYNSYVILDEKIAVLDTVDRRATAEWFSNIEEILAGREPDYLVVSHLEPDHAFHVADFVRKYPSVQIVGNAKTFAMIPQFFDLQLSEDKKVVVKEGDRISLGAHTLQFFMAPMVHWPEVMVTYEESEKVLFSADGFGKFGALDVEEDWEAEARRYYFNIVGKYGAPVQALLKKAAALDIQMICPLHGPILKENLGYYIGLYDTWSRYEPQCEGVLLAYASFYGNTGEAVSELSRMLQEKGIANVLMADLAREDVSNVVADAFCYDRLVLACPTYDGSLFPAVETFLNHLAAKSYQKRSVALIENGSWAPAAAKKMREVFEKMRDITIVEPTVTIKSAVKEEDKAALLQLAEALCR